MRVSEAKKDATGLEAADQQSRAIFSLIELGHVLDWPRNAASFNLIGY